MNPNTDPFVLIEQHKQLARDAEKRRGKKATNKVNRAYLEMLFAKRGPSPLPYHVRTCAISYAYPPSIVKVAELKPMLIEELRLETHHRGRVLFVRAFGHATRFQAVQNGVEDERGNVDRLALYNSDTSITPERTLPRGTIFAVKEPFYKATADGGYTIRVDHPSDLVRLAGNDDLVPPALAPRLIELDISATALKAAGNAAYGKKDYHAAIDSYSEALRACSDTESILRHDLHRNRANANLLLSRFEPALADAEAAIIQDVDPPTEATAKLNSKALYRAGRAAYCLRKFQQVKAFFLQVEICTPGDADAQRELKRTLCRIAEQETGCYDFAAMSRAATGISRRLDYADYTAKCEVREAGKRGRGLFATTEIKVGDLIMCEKAFSAAFPSESRKDMYIVINLNTERMSAGPHAHLLFNVVQKLSHSPQQAQEFFELYDGGYKPKVQPQIVDGVTVLDTFRAAAISEFNCFGWEDAGGKAGSEDDYKVTQGDPPLSPVGLWSKASLINHSCVGNAARTMIGDMMVVHACHDIKAGEEITMRYTNSKEDGKATQAHTKKVWGFECDCVVCEADASTSFALRKRREVLVKEIEAFLIKHRLTEKSMPGLATIKKVEKLRTDLKATYGKAAFEGRARIKLAPAGVWLCQAYDLRHAQDSVLDYTKLLFRDLGYKVEITKEKGLSIDCANGYIGPSVIDAALYAAQAKHFQGDVVLNQKFTELAMLLWKIIYADMSGFGKVGRD
ncbi:hypothetical protein LTR10_003759 [Elasticomyces elasticus]|nr:hypothetical protein LTR10_003759 [Elasticomyces elasticus]KAK4978050.1 hypothetical protein LTR42_002425 [Elasticomyces elasticus]